jgi:OmpA-OmpF porin, OOP family
MNKILSACAIAAAFAAMPASAQWYVGAGVGSSRTNGIDGSASGFTLSGGNSNKSSVKVFGGYQITPFWGVEAQYTDLGNRDFTVRDSTGGLVGSGKVKASQYSIAGTGTLPLSQSFALIGKLGVSNNRGSVSFPGVSSSGNKSDVLVGVGVSYSINPKLAVRLEYEDFGKFSSNGGFAGTSIRANNTSLNLQYAF